MVGGQNLRAVRPAERPGTDPAPGGGPLRKSLAVLEALAEAPRPLTLSDLSRRTGQPKSTLHRQLRILTELGLIVRMESKSYQLGTYLFHLAATSGPARLHSLGHKVTPYLIELFQLTRKIVSLGLLSGTRIQHVGTLYGQEHIPLATALRRPFPAHASAAGKLLLAKNPDVPADLGEGGGGGTRREAARADAMRRELERIRRTGLSYAPSQHIPGLVELAAPVTLGRGGPVAALVVGDTVHNRDLRSAGRVLLDTVGAIEESLLQPP
ncbi:IclR family transcriptional regulator [Streptomyces sp. XM4011]|uniref:IclR family transcriptional regulator n=1 Tax=Streptomyces TaxID=1883 RepID=UPI001FFA5EFB|nr:IclR family transcriptional regulator [Streptomyces sp. XM4011]MCK1813935.1 IclR family transcriptional regulator [Streptomyces sp. XM4011]